MSHRSQELNREVEATQKLIADLVQRIAKAEAEGDARPSAEQPVTRESLSGALHLIAALKRSHHLEDEQAAAVKTLVLQGDARVIACCTVQEDLETMGSDAKRAIADSLRALI